jgi:DNA-binding transcriptional ArsR family regulator
MCKRPVKTGCKIHGNDQYLSPKFSDLDQSSQSALASLFFLSLIMCFQITNIIVYRRLTIQWEYGQWERVMNNDRNADSSSDKTVIKWSERLTALSHPARLEILRYLARRENCCCKDVVAQLPLAQSTVSQHLKVLVAAGLVNCKNEAPRSHYSLNKDALMSISDAVSNLAGICCKSSCCGSSEE